MYTSNNILPTNFLLIWKLKNTVKFQAAILLNLIGGGGGGGGGGGEGDGTRYISLLCDILPVCMIIP